MKTGLIDIGGGMRDIYGAGVLDYCMDKKITFDHLIGISAGSANVSSFLSGQKGRNYRFYTIYVFRREYMSISNFIKNRNYIDLEYIYGILSRTGGEDPFDYEAAISNPAFCEIAATNAVTGKPEFFDFSEMGKDDYFAIKASGCVPVVNKPYLINEIPYYDGGASDPIPIDRCLAAGCDKIVLILTRPKDFRRSPKKDRLAVKLLKHKYPKMSETMKHRAEKYNAELDKAEELEKQGKVLIIAPDDIGGMKTLTRDKETMDNLYRKGYKDAQAIVSFLEI